MRSSTNLRFAQVLFLSIILSVVSPTTATPLSCRKVFDSSTLSSQEFEILGKLRLAKAYRGHRDEKFVKVYRGLTGSFKKFSPIAHEFRPNKRDLWVTADRDYATQYALPNQSQFIAQEGYLLELTFPNSAFSHGQLYVDLDKIPMQDLRPYIKRVGIIKIDKTRMQSLGAFEQKLTLKIVQKWAKELSQIDFQFSKSSFNREVRLALRLADLDPYEVDSLRENFLAEYISYQISKDNPDYITWHTIRK